MAARKQWQPQKSLGNVGGFFSSIQAIADESQLPHKQPNLYTRSKEQKQRETSQPASIGGQIFSFIGELLGLIGDQFVDSRFFIFFAPLSLLLSGLLFGALSGNYFYRERYLIGAALIACNGCAGWALGAWSGC